MEKLSGQGRGKISNFLMKYTMVIALVVVFLLFAVLTGGKNLLPLNMSNVLAFKFRVDFMKPDGDGDRYTIYPPGADPDAGV